MKTLHLLGISAAMAAFAHGAGIPNNDIANLVLGQEDFVSDDSPSEYDPFNMSDATAVAIDPITGKVFVGDEDGDRVLRFPNLASLKNGAGAEAVFGQSNFSDEGSNVSRQEMDNPEGLFVDHRGRLWVADNGNNRVLMFEMASQRSTFAFADRVYGQPDFITDSGGTTALKMNAPSAVWVTMDDTLWVADRNSNRVLRFDSISTKGTGAAADGVLGQPDFVTSLAGAGGTGLQSPNGLAVGTGGALFVSCSNAHRIMRFSNASSLANGASASGVLGQIDFVGISSGTSAATLNSPGGLEITAADELWVADRSNNRMLRYAGASTLPSGSMANGVVGQVNFTSSADPSPPTARSLTLGTSTPCVPAVDASGALWVADEDNNRVLRFPSDVTKPLLSVVKPPKVVTKRKLKITGTASDQYGIARVQYMVGKGPVKNASGTTSWSFRATLAKGKTNRIKIWAIDSVGNISAVKLVKVRRN